MSNGAPPRPDESADAQDRTDGAPPRPDQAADRSSEGGDEPGRPTQEAKEEGDRRQREAEEAMQRSGQEGSDDGTGSPLDDLHELQERLRGEGR